MGAIDENVEHITTPGVHTLPSMMAGGRQVALTTEQLCVVPLGPQRVTVLSIVTVADVVQVVTVVVIVNCTVAEIRNVALM